MAFSKSHMSEELLLTNTDILAGVDESTVAYFPLITSATDIINGVKPYDRADYTLTPGVGMVPQLLQYRLNDLGIRDTTDWSVAIRCYLSNDLSSWTKRRAVLSLGEYSASGATSITISTGGSFNDVGCTLPSEFTVYTRTNTTDTAATPIELVPNEWWSFILTYQNASDKLALYVLDDNTTDPEFTTLTMDISSLNYSDNSVLTVGGYSVDASCGGFLTRDLRIFNRVVGADEAILLHRQQQFSSDERVKM